MADFSRIEKKWEKLWQKAGVFEPDLKRAKKPFYNLMMFPYPSAEGLHIGNMYAFVGSDIYGRFKRMQGNDVFEPIGLDGFGIHSENYALKVKRHPAKQAKISEKNFYRQLSAIGNGFAWKEKLETYDPEYYKWTQWIFIQMFKRGLAYRKKSAVNWCPSCKTVLADEQVLHGGMQGSGECERCEAKVIKKDLEQWFFKTTKYAEELLRDLEKIDWSEKVKIAQRNWIGRSEGAEIDFPLNLPPLSGEIVFATSNRGKLARMQKLFKAAGLAITLKMPAEVGIENFDVVEDAKTLQENAEKKARAIAAKTSLPVFADDSGFFVDGVEIDPITVKRNALAGVDEKILSIEEIAGHMQQYYQNIASAHGGKVDAEWRNALCFITPEKFVAHIETIRPVILTSQSRGKVDPYLPLRGLYISKTTGKYVLEQSEEEELRELQPITDGVKKLFTPAIKVFTTRPDTLFGTTYMVLSPEHSLIGNLKLQIENRLEVEEYIKKARPSFSEVSEGREKTGVELKGIKALNPANKEEIPIWVADYVLGGVGTGAIMAVPAHDQRDFEFAKKFNLPIRKVVLPKAILALPRNAEDIAMGANEVLRVESECYTGAGELINSGKFNEMESEKAKWEITKFVGGERKIQYRLRDWLISRQRYWGPPIPMIFCKKCSWQVVPEKDLPVKLPFIKDYRPKGTGFSPLATEPKFYKVKCPKCKGEARRETDVSDNFLDSTWYFFRYLDVKNKREIFSKAVAKKWLPVDMYTGGAEHSVLHLLYVRFITKAFNDLGLISFREPFKKFRAHGLIIKDGAKMSKSKGNVVSPDEYIKKFGADALRMYLMFLGPFDQGGDFRDSGISGLTRFLARVHKLNKKLAKSSKDRLSEDSERLLHQSIKKITEDIENLRYNTAISQLMILLNKLEELPKIPWDAYDAFLKLLAPFTPYISEELYQKSKFSRQNSIHLQAWPKYDANKIKEDTFLLVIQVNGRVRATIKVPIGISQDEAERLAKSDENVKKFLAGTPKKVVFVPDKLINFVL